MQPLRSLQVPIARLASFGDADEADTIIRTIPCQAPGPDTNILAGTTHLAPSLPALSVWGVGDAGNDVQASVVTGPMATLTDVDAIENSFLAVSTSLDGAQTFTDSPSAAQIKVAQGANSWAASVVATGPFSVLGIDLVLPPPSDQRWGPPSLLPTLTWPAFAIRASTPVTSVPPVFAFSLASGVAGTAAEGDLQSFLAEQGFGRVPTAPARPSEGRVSLSVQQLIQPSPAAANEPLNTWQLWVDALVPSPGSSGPRYTAVSTGCFIIIPAGWSSVGAFWTPGDPDTLVAGESAFLARSQLGYLGIRSPVGLIPPGASALLVRSAQNPRLSPTPNVQATIAVSIT